MNKLRAASQGPWGQTWFWTQETTCYFTFYWWRDVEGNLYFSYAA